MLHVLLGGEEVDCCNRVKNDIEQDLMKQQL